MTAALIALAVAQPVTFCGCLWLLTRYLNERDDRTWKEIQVLCNRIQAPETAVAQTLVPAELPDELTPDTEWTEADAHERLMSTFTDGA